MAIRHIVKYSIRIFIENPHILLWKQPKQTLPKLEPENQMNIDNTAEVQFALKRPLCSYETESLSPKQSKGKSKCNIIWTSHSKTYLYIKKYVLKLKTYIDFEIFFNSVRN